MALSSRAIAQCAEPWPSPRPRSDPLVRAGPASLHGDRRARSSQRKLHHEQAEGSLAEVPRERFTYLEERRSPHSIPESGFDILRRRRRGAPDHEFIAANALFGVTSLDHPECCGWIERAPRRDIHARVPPAAVGGIKTEGGLVLKALQVGAELDRLVAHSETSASEQRQRVVGGNEVLGPLADFADRLRALDRGVPRAVDPGAVLSSVACADQETGRANEAKKYEPSSQHASFTRSTAPEVPRTSGAASFV
jgi:hypothetical protein